MTNCDEYELLLSTRLDGALSSEEADRLEAHLAVCSRCRALEAELTALEGLWDELPPVQPPACLNERIMASVRADNITPLVRAEHQKRPLRRKCWAAAAVLAVILIGAGGLRFFHQSATPQTADLSDTQENTVAPAEANSENSMVGFRAVAPEARGAAPEADSAETATQPSTTLILALPPQDQALALCADQLFPEGEASESLPSDDGQAALSLLLPDGSSVLLTCGETTDEADRYLVTCRNGDSTALYWVDLAEGTVTSESQ